MWRGKGTALDLLWEVAVGLGSWEQTAEMQMGVPQSLEDNPGYSWLPREGNLPLGQVIHQWTGSLRW